MLSYHQQLIDWHRAHSLWCSRGKGGGHLWTCVFWVANICLPCLDLECIAFLHVSIVTRVVVGALDASWELNTTLPAKHLGLQQPPFLFAQLHVLPRGRLCLQFCDAGCLARWGWGVVAVICSYVCTCDSFSLRSPASPLV